MPESEKYLVNIKRDFTAISKWRMEFILFPPLINSTSFMYENFVRKCI